MSSLMEPTDEQFVAAQSRARLAALVEAGPVLRRACRVLEARAAAPEGYALKTALARLREAAPVCMLDVMDLPPEPVLIQALGRALYAALQVAWVVEAKYIAARPF